MIVSYISCYSLQPQLRSGVMITGSEWSLQIPKVYPELNVSHRGIDTLQRAVATQRCPYPRLRPKRGKAPENTFWEPNGVEPAASARPVVNSSAISLHRGLRTGNSTREETTKWARAPIGPMVAAARGDQTAVLNRRETAHATLLSFAPHPPFCLPLLSA